MRAIQPWSLIELAFVIDVVCRAGLAPQRAQIFHGAVLIKKSAQTGRAVGISHDTDLHCSLKGPCSSHGWIFQRDSPGWLKGVRYFYRFSSLSRAFHAGGALTEGLFAARPSTTVKVPDSSMSFKLAGSKSIVYVETVSPPTPDKPVPTRKQPPKNRTILYDFPLKFPSRAPAVVISPFPPKVTPDTGR